LVNCRIAAGSSAAGNSSGIEISHNNISGGSTLLGPGIELNAQSGQVQSGMIVSDNIVNITYSQALDCIQVSATAGGIIKDCTISNNILTHTTDSNVGGYGVLIYAPSSTITNVSVTQNNIVGGAFGVRLEGGVTLCSVMSNTIKEQYLGGISLLTTPTLNTISGNTISSNGTSAEIRINEGTYNSIVGNIFKIYAAVSIPCISLASTASFNTIVGNVTSSTGYSNFVYDTGSTGSNVIGANIKPATLVDALVASDTYVAKVMSGTYSGSGAANKAIAHGLGKIPQLVIITKLNSTRGWQILGSNPTQLQEQATFYSNAVTTMDATNFYVGNTADGYADTANDSGITYFWVALG
jgi:parallel beta-helix repeat protein